MLFLCLVCLIFLALSEAFQSRSLGVIPSKNRITTLKSTSFPGGAISNALIAANCVAYVGGTTPVDPIAAEYRQLQQSVGQGKAINSVVSTTLVIGEAKRLIHSCFYHYNLQHLILNSFAINEIVPQVRQFTCSGCINCVESTAEWEFMVVIVCSQVQQSYRSSVAVPAIAYLIGGATSLASDYVVDNRNRPIELSRSDACIQGMNGALLAHHLSVLWRAKRREASPSSFTSRNSSRALQAECESSRIAVTGLLTTVASNALMVAMGTTHRPDCDVVGKSAGFLGEWLLSSSSCSCSSNMTYFLTYC